MTITIYAASSGQIPAVYAAAAAELGSILAERGHTLVNGAGRTGLMAAVTDAVLHSGGEAVGVIPEFMIENGWHHEKMSRLITTPDMHTRKQTMARLSDACIALPGGVGTLEELLEIITWKQLGLYDRPIVVLNVGGYFDPLLEMLSRCADQHFMRSEHLRLWVVANSPAEAVALCEQTPLWDRTLSKDAYIKP